MRNKGSILSGCLMRIAQRRTNLCVTLGFRRNTRMRNKVPASTTGDDARADQCDAAPGYTLALQRQGERTGEPALTPVITVSGPPPRERSGFGTTDYSKGTGETINVESYRMKSATMLTENMRPANIVMNPNPFTNHRAAFGQPLNLSTPLNMRVMVIKKDGVIMSSSTM